MIIFIIIINIFNIIKFFFMSNIKPHYKVLVLGKTGAGKSTAINMMIN